MALTLIFKWKGSGLKSRRSDKEKQLKAEGWGASMDEEQLSKLDFLERKMANDGFEQPLFLRGKAVEKVK